MKIVRLETLRLSELPRLLFLKIETDGGITGYSDTYEKVQATEGALHGTLAPLLIGQNPLEIERLWHLNFDNIAYHGLQGAEMRALSMVDMALWDIFGKSSDLPVSALLGGRMRDLLPCYNTCFGYGAFDDYSFWLRDAGELAEQLWSEGYRGMKIWPFDRFSAASNGQSILSSEIEEGLQAVRKIRERVGDKMRIAIEGHFRWNGISALRIAKALEPFDIWFFEDPMPAVHTGELAKLGQMTNIPLVASETLLTRFPLLDILVNRAAGIIMTDPAWTGGITETRKIASLAHAFGVPLMLHNLGGPLAHAACCQVAATIPNLLAVETSRAITRTYFPEISDLVVTVDEGLMDMPTAPGLGVTLSEEIWRRRDAITRATSKGAGDVPKLANLGDPWASSHLRR